MTIRIDTAVASERERGMTVALAALRRGEVIVLPVEAGYALAADAFSATGAAALRELKQAGPGSPLPVMVGSIGMVAGIAYDVSAEAQAIIEGFWPGLVTMLLTPQPSLAWDLPRDRPLTVRMPLHPLALSVLAASGPLIVTGANAPGAPMPRTVDEVLAGLSDEPAVALDSGELAADALASTVVDATGPVVRVVREGAVPASELRMVVPSLEQ